MSTAPESTRRWYLLELTNDGVYTGTCDEGHQITQTLENPRYELVYEAGVAAMLLGFYREAVASMATALERFFEFAAEVFCEARAVEPRAFAESWKQVASQSERQLGAFFFLYLVTFEKPARALAAARALNDL